MAQRGTSRASVAQRDRATLWGGDSDGSVPAADHTPGARDDGAVLVDCDTCSVRGPGCGDCVVSVLLGMPAPRLHIDGGQVQALGVLARSGLVPPLRHDRAG